MRLRISRSSMHAHAGPRPPHDVVAERVERADLALRVARAGRRAGPASRRPPAGCRRARTRSPRRSRARPRGDGTAPASTVVLPEPAGARIRAGPPACSTAARWSGASRSRPRLSAGSTSARSCPDSIAKRCTIAPRRPRGPGRARPAVAPRRRAVGEQHVGRPVRPARRAAAPPRPRPNAACRRARRSCWRGRGSSSARAAKSNAGVSSYAGRSSVSGALSASRATRRSTTTGVRVAHSCVQLVDRLARARAAPRRRAPPAARRPTARARARPTRRSRRARARPARADATRRASSRTPATPTDPARSRATIVTRPTRMGGCRC